MYFEAMQHTTRPVENAAAAALLIKTRRDDQDYLHDYDALQD